MGQFTEFDAGFDATAVSASIIRNGADGRTRSGKLTGAVPTGMTLEEFGEAARYGLKRAMKGKDRGATLAKSVPELTGDRAIGAVRSIGDPVAPPKPDSVPDATRHRGRSVLSRAGPSENNSAPHLAPPGAHAPAQWTGAPSTLRGLPRSGRKARQRDEVGAAPT